MQVRLLPGTLITKPKEIEMSKSECEELCPLCSSGLHIRTASTFEKERKGKNCAPNMSAWDCGSRRIDGQKIVPGWKCRARTAEKEVKQLRKENKQLQADLDDISDTL